MKKMLFASCAGILLSGHVMLGAASSVVEPKKQVISPPSSDQNLRINAPINLWSDALPLGNGLLGGLLWGENNTVRLSLDRGDLWDERPVWAHHKRWWKHYPWKTVRGKGFKVTKNAGTGITPTKLSGGRLEIQLHGSAKASLFELNYATAEGTILYSNKKTLRTFFSATDSVVVMHIPAKVKSANYFLAPKKIGTGRNWARYLFKQLGYKPAVKGKKGTAKWTVQHATKDLDYCVYTQTKEVNGETLLVLAFTATSDLKPGEDVLSLARKRCEKAIAAGYKKMITPHLAWWKNFWSQSQVRVPEKHIQEQYDFVRYLYGAGARDGAPAMPLQGVWTADEGTLPPWNGDYHHDLNLQMCYIGYHGAGHFNAGKSLFTHYFKLRPILQRFAKEYYETDGLAVPGAMSLKGQLIGGWPQYAVSPTGGAWVAHLFYLHWLYTKDKKFLRECAWPWVRDVGISHAQLLKPNASGRLVLPFSTSPEMHAAKRRAWMCPNTNYDLMCMKMLFLSLQEMAVEMGNKAEEKKWKNLAEKLGDYHVAKNGELLLSPREGLGHSHRHFSNILAIYPFNLIHIDGDDTMRKRINATMKQWDRLGTILWSGFSFPWMSCLRARIGDSEAALRNLDIFVRAFTTRCGFNTGGDQLKRGFLYPSNTGIRICTIEGNFEAMQAVHEMLLQSWSPTPGKPGGEVIRIFPAMPWRWHDASFSDLRAEGRHKVSAIRKNNATIQFKVIVGTGGIVRIRDNFGGRALNWNCKVRKVGKNFEIKAKVGDIIQATLATPKSIPAKPKNAAKPIIVGK